MRCLGVGAVGYRHKWTDRDRYSDMVVCPACGKLLQPRKDGRVRAHSDTRPLDALAVPTPRRPRAVTQK